MSAAVGWVVTAVGALLVAAVLRDIFSTLFHPSGQGRISWTVMRVVWRLVKLRRPREPGSLGGPLAMLSVMGTWAGMLLLGWALVYWPHLPEGFAFGSSLRPGLRSDALDALYLSLVTATTLGYGDVLPTAGWLRVAAPLEALMGFGLLTAAVTWVLQVYPALARRRALALRLTTLRRDRPAAAVARVDSSMVASLLEGLAAELVAARVDLTQYPETYFFQDTSADLALAARIGHLAELRDAGERSGREDVRLAAGQLRCALDDLARFLDAQFLQAGGTADEVLSAYAEDHGYPAARP